MTETDTSPPPRTSAPGRGAIAAGASCAVAGLAVVGHWLATLGPRNSTSVSGGEALIVLLLFVGLAVVAAASAASAALGAVAGSVAGRTGKPWLGMLAGLGLGVLAALLLLLRFVGGSGHLDTLSALLEATWPVAAALGVPAAIGGLFARPARVPALPRLPSVAPQVQAAASSAVAAAGAVQRVAVPLAEAVHRRLPGELRAPDARNALARWPLLLLLFVALAMFTVFVLLSAPDLAPWAGTDFWLAQAINAGAMPWSKAVTAWVLRSQGAADPFVAALLVGLGLGFNGALLAGLLAGLRRTVPVR